MNDRVCPQNFEWLCMEKFWMDMPNLSAWVMVLRRCGDNKDPVKTELPAAEKKIVLVQNSVN